MQSSQGTDDVIFLKRDGHMGVHLLLFFKLMAIFYIPFFCMVYLNWVFLKLVYDYFRLVYILKCFI